MSEYTDYFDPSAVEAELAPGYEYDPFAYTKENSKRREVGGAARVDWDTTSDADQGEGY